MAFGQPITNQSTARRRSAVSDAKGAAPVEQGGNALSFRRAIGLSAALPLALIIMLSALLSWQIWQTGRALRWVEDTLTVQARANAVARDLEQMETGQRGILVTRNPEFGVPYEKGRTRIGGELGNLEWLVSDNTQQLQLVRQIRQTESKWAKNAQYEVALRMAGDPRFLAYFEAGKGRRLMVTLRQEINLFQAREQSLLRARQEAFWRDAVRAGAIGGIGLVVVAMLVGVFGFRQLRAFDRAHEELKRRGAALREANDQLLRADSYKDEFLSVVSHELRTPLNFITGFASTLDDEVQGPLNPQQHEALTKILSGSDQMLALVDNLLDLARIQSGKLDVAPEPTKYATLVRDALDHLRPLALRAGVTLRLEATDVGNLEIDGQRIAQVLINLVGNAIKFSRPGTEIRVSVRVQGDRVITEVADQGVGIAAEDLPRLFQRFGQLDMSNTRKVGGTGLGLAICRALVEAHGGEIHAYSQGLGKGSTFSFSLPYAPVPAPMLS
ncbi:MAG TPA: ATP-binding protein [Oscillatoriaceae cyanobacterium]